MNNLVKSSLLVLSTGFLVTPVFADTAVKSNSIYISGDAGAAFLATPDQDLAKVDTKVDGIFLITDASHDIGNFAGSANLGFNHKFNQHVLAGAEFGYDYNGQSKYTVDYSRTVETPADYTDTLKISSWDLHLLATGTYLFNNGLNVFAKAGAARVEQKATFESGIADASSDETTTGYKPMVATGIGYQYKMANIYVQYSHIFATNADNFNDLVDSNGDMKIASVDAIKAGIAFSLSI